jgi:hypothetical protein
LLLLIFADCMLNITAIDTPTAIATTIPVIIATFLLFIMLKELEIIN